VLTIRSDAGYGLKFDSLERIASGIELLGVSQEGDVTTARVYVPPGKHTVLLRKIIAYGEKQTQQGAPRNAPLVESIESIRLAAIRDFWQDDPTLFPGPNEQISWEVWLHRGERAGDATHAEFSEKAQRVGLSTSPLAVVFPERVVTRAFGTREQLSASLEALFLVAELRRAKEVPSRLLELGPGEQRQLIDDLLARTTFRDSDAAVCILDTGINRIHPLLAFALDEADTHALRNEWGLADDQNHGTRMAGLALYGCLSVLFAGGQPVVLRHRLESVKLLPPPPDQNQEKDYGPFTIQAVALAEIQAPNRNRAICMAITTDDRDEGMPSLWSATLDHLSSGALDDGRRLMFVSAGNIEQLSAPYVYHQSNCSTGGGIQDPAQAWNVVTVGAVTERVTITDPTFNGWEPMAEAGDLSPRSRTSLAWPEANRKGWPTKPDIVMEGGNYAVRGADVSDCEDLSLLTTVLRRGNPRLLDMMTDTSPATADASRIAAIIWSQYPNLWPETVRALLIHSATWTPAMRHRYPSNQKAEIQKCMRCYGYGVPNLQRALWSAENVATLVFEGELTPYHKVGSQIRSHEMHIHRLPWPTDVLQELGAMRITMRVTLSYFVEPSPGRIGWDNKHRYQSHGLRFDVMRPTENEADFRLRLSSEGREASEPLENAQETRHWTVGDRGRRNGSIHSDWWTGTAAELAACDRIAVYPVTGWWRERPHLAKYDKAARYSLVVTIEAADEQVDIYTPIVNQTTLVTELEIQD
jgi:subtilisin family serine protease